MRSRGTWYVPLEPAQDRNANSKPFKGNNRLIHEAISHGLRFDRSFNMATTHFIHIVLVPRSHRRRSKRYVVRSARVEPLNRATDLLEEVREYDKDCTKRLGLWNGTDYLGALAILTFQSGVGTGSVLAPRTFCTKVKYGPYNSDWVQVLIDASVET